MLPPGLLWLALNRDGLIATQTCGSSQQDTEAVILSPMHFRISYGAFKTPQPGPRPRDLRLTGRGWGPSLGGTKRLIPVRGRGENQQHKETALVGGQGLSESIVTV